MERASVLKEFETIPGVGKRIAGYLYDLGYRDIRELKTAEPHMMYERLCINAGRHLARRVLYTFRLAVYFVSTKKPDARKLKWWNWKK